MISAAEGEETRGGDFSQLIAIPYNLKGFFPFFPGQLQRIRPTEQENMQLANKYFC